MAADDLGFEKVEGSVKLIKTNGSFMQIHFEGARPAGKGPKELAEYIAAQVQDQLPAPPSEMVALKTQVEKLEQGIKDRDNKILALENSLKKAK